MGSEERPGHAPLVLVVEDDEDIADSLVSLLESESFRVAVASDGLSALSHARSLRPDLILIDLMLPRLDGVSFAEELRGGELRGVPLILCSAGRQLEQAAHRIGTPYFIRKPFELDEFLALIRRALDERSRAAVGADPARDPKKGD